MSNVPAICTLPFTTLSHVWQLVHRIQPSALNYLIMHGTSICSCSVVCVLCVCVQPIFLNEVMLRKSADDDPDGTVFHLSHVEHLYSLRAPSTAERFVMLFFIVVNVFVMFSVYSCVTLVQ